MKRNDLTLKKCENSSPEVSNEPLSNNVEISCQESYLGKGSGYPSNTLYDTSNTLTASPDFNLESLLKV